MKTWIAVIAVFAQVLSLAGTISAQPFTRILSPVQDQCVPGPDVVIKFEAGGMTLGPSAWNLHFMLDEEPFQVQYDGNHAHVFKNVRPGTHTVRVYAANAMQEAIPGTQSTVSFSVAYPDKANYVMPGQPTLTYNLPQGEYFGIDAADVTVDFLVENVTLSPGGYQVAYYADGRRFIVQDHCGPRHLKNLAPGYHRIRVELQNQFGDLVPGTFNSTERIILISPDSLKKSPSPVDDGYRGLPRIDSIKGSMTMGQHWSATELEQPLTPADIEEQKSLTVRDTNGDTVDLREGELLNPNEAPRATETEVDITKEFTVRQGGETDSVDLDTVNTDNVRRGSIVIDQDGESDPAEMETEEINDAGIEVEESVTTARMTTRRRADGTTTTVRQTTETLRLADRPGTPETERSTMTRTVRPDDSETTKSRRRERNRDDNETSEPTLD